MLTRTFIKTVWAFLITIFTALTAYGQYQSSVLVVRPSLTIEQTTSSEKMKKLRGVFSHDHRIRNTGQITANQTRVSATTKLNGEILHQDIDDPLGLIARDRVRVYEIHVHQERVKSYDPMKHTILEEVKITYQGSRRLFRFWCTPTYTYQVTYKYRNPEQDWIVQKEPTEEESCQ